VRLKVTFPMPFSPPPEICSLHSLFSCWRALASCRPPPTPTKTRHVPTSTLRRTHRLSEMARFPPAQEWPVEAVVVPAIGRVMQLRFPANATDHSGKTRCSRPGAQWRTRTIGPTSRRQGVAIASVGLGQKCRAGVAAADRLRRWADGGSDRRTRCGDVGFADRRRVMASGCGGASSFLPTGRS